jgi:ABC-type nitrate/sulfonate/bicarbonate transport system ATPase subunit
MRSDVLTAWAPFASTSYHLRGVACLHVSLLETWEKTHQTITFVTHDLMEAITLHPTGSSSAPALDPRSVILVRRQCGEPAASADRPAGVEHVTHIESPEDSANGRTSR